MAGSASGWKKGRGRLGLLDPLIGEWASESDSPVGKVRCLRAFARVLGGSYVQLTATWEAGGRAYEEIAMYGAGEKGAIHFWSFTSDGKRSEGSLADVSDVHPQAVGFEAQMPAGRARMAYWPDGEGGFHWVVEARTKKGWKRFTEHRYRPA